MKFRQILITILLPLAFFSCKSSEDGVSPTSATIEGTVVDEITSRGVPSVLIRTLQYNETTTTDSTGHFQLELAVGDSFSGNVTLEASRGGYVTQRTDVRVNSGQLANMPTMRLIRSGDTSGTSSGEAVSIIYIGSDVASISVRETGTVETARLTFEARDIRSIPVDINNRVTMHFQIEGATGGGEYLGNDSAQTDENGRAVCALFSGTRPGTIQILATVQDTIRARPVRMTIHSGPPDSVHTTLGFANINFPTLGVMGMVDTVYVIVGDRYSNPVPAGTNVYFSSENGVIEAQGITDDFGRASVLLQSGNPYPFSTSGWSRVFSQTVDWTGHSYTIFGTLLWTGGVATIDIDPSSFEIENGGTQGFSVHVADIYDHPLSAGTRFFVQSTAGQLNGDVSLIYPDTQSPAWTNFYFSLSDFSPEDTLAPVEASITVTITSPIFGQAGRTVYGTVD
ncbi:MAG: carboxypeptidase regulatory-like domain-containing protein [bacterium]|nr:carboxypeptidase regulatory-like domain-containing protein [bacterium]